MIIKVLTKLINLSLPDKKSIYINSIKTKLIFLLFDTIKTL
jgi:hypothetical protein